MGKFKYVYIPCDGSQPLQEQELEFKPEDEVGCLMDQLKSHFQKVGGTANMTREAMRQTLEQNLPAGTALTESMLDMAMQHGGSLMNLVEQVSLLTPVKENDYTGISMYVDDAGKSKNLPANIRATQITAACEKPTQILGDAFLAKCIESDDKYERLDFPLSHVSSTAEWVTKAAEYNRARGPPVSDRSIFRGAAASGGQQQKTPQADLSPAQQARGKGNELYKEQRFDKAAEEYTKAINLEPTNGILYSNRAMANLKLKKWEAAVEDATSALNNLSETPDLLKALFRRSKGLRKLGKVDKAKEDLQKMIGLDASNKDAKKALAQINAATATTEVAAAETEDATT